MPALNIKFILLPNLVRKKFKSSKFIDFYAARYFEKGEGERSEIYTFTIYGYPRASEKRNDSAYNA
jgi:hypothetical protein